MKRRLGHLPPLRSQQLAADWDWLRHDLLLQFSGEAASDLGEDKVSDVALRQREGDGAVHVLADHVDRLSRLPCPSDKMPVSAGPCCCF